mgnify:CR=1 FL=1
MDTGLPMDFHQHFDHKLFHGWNLSTSSRIYMCHISMVLEWYYHFSSTSSIECSYIASSYHMFYQYYRKLLAFVALEQYWPYLSTISRHLNPSGWENESHMLSFLFLLCKFLLYPLCITWGLFKPKTPSISINLEYILHQIAWMIWSCGGYINVKIKWFYVVILSVKLTLFDNQGIISEIALSWRHIYITLQI